MKTPSTLVLSEKFRTTVLTLFLMTGLFVRPVNGNAQPIPLSFTGTPAVNGTPGAVNTTYTWSNIGSTGLSTIRGVMRIMSITGTASISNIDLAEGGTDYSWQPIINGSASNNGSWSIRFRLSFFDNFTGLPLTLSSFRSSAIDLDGDGGKLREFVQFSQPGTYTVEDPTDLTVTQQGSDVRFTSPQAAYSGISINNTRVNATCNYMNKTSIDLQLGSTCVGGACTAGGITRQYSINFRDAVPYNGGMIVLPVHFVSINASPLVNGTKISWEVSEQRNVVRYELQRSYDGGNFTAIRSIPFEETMISRQHYAAIDSEAPHLPAYYRVASIDLDGRIGYSATVRSSVSQQLASLTLIGNPSAELRMNYVSPENQHLQIQVLSSIGQMMQITGVSVSKGLNAVHLPELDHLHAGIYVILVTDGTGRRFREEWVKR